MRVRWVNINKPLQDCIMSCLRREHGNIDSYGVYNVFTGLYGMDMKWNDFSDSDKIMLQNMFVNVKDTLTHYQMASTINKYEQYDCSFLTICNDRFN